MPKGSRHIFRAVLSGFLTLAVVLLPFSSFGVHASHHRPHGLDDTSLLAGEHDDTAAKALVTLSVAEGTGTKPCQDSDGGDHHSRCELGTCMAWSAMTAPSAVTFAAAALISTMYAGATPRVPVGLGATPAVRPPKPIT